LSYGSEIINHIKLEKLPYNRFFRVRVATRD